MRDVSVKHEDLKGAGVFLRGIVRLINFMQELHWVLKTFLLRIFKKFVFFTNFVQDIHWVLKKFPSESDGCFLPGFTDFTQDIHWVPKKF